MSDTGSDQAADEVAEFIVDEWLAGIVPGELSDLGPGAYILGKMWTEGIINQIAAAQELLAQDLRERNGSRPAGDKPSGPKEES